MRGLIRTAEGSELFRGSRISAIKHSFKDARKEYLKATRSFDDAYGSGRRIPHVWPIAREFRCLLPGLRGFATDVEKSLEQTESVNEEAVKERIGEDIESLEKVLSRCKESLPPRERYPIVNTPEM
jgi:hypothetical protein